MTVRYEILERARDRNSDYPDRSALPTEADNIWVQVLPVLEAFCWDIEEVEDVRNEYWHVAQTTWSTTNYCCANHRLLLEAGGLTNVLTDGWFICDDFSESFKN